MAYYLDLYSVGNATRLGRLTKIKEGSGRAVFELMGEESLLFTVSDRDPLRDAILEKRWVRLVDADNPASYRSFCIEEIIDQIPQGEAQVTCEGLKSRLMNERVMAGTKGYVGITAATALGLALQGTSFTVGTVNALSTNVNSITFNSPSVLEAIQQIIDIWYYDDSGVRKQYYYRVNENLTVDILTEANLGTTRHFRICYDKNAKAITRRRNCRGLANRVYGIGAEGFTLERYFPPTVECEILGNEWDCGEETGHDYVHDDYAGHIVRYGQFDGFNLWVSDSTGSQKRLIANTIFEAIEPGGPDHVIVPDTPFEEPYPQGGTQGDDTYIPMYFENEDSSTYDLGLAFGSSDPVYRKRPISGNLSLHYLDTGDNPVTRNLAFSVNVEGISSGIHFINFETVWEADGYDILFHLKIFLLDSNQTEVLSAEITDAFEGKTEGCYSHITQLNYSLGEVVDYIDDATSQASFGIICDKFESELEDTINLIDTPSLSGTYADGLCEDWTKVGSPTVSENTDPLYVTNGTKSQKIAATAAGQGISQAITTEANKSYSAYFKVYVEGQNAGNVKCIVTDGTTDSFGTTSGVGWIEIPIENFSYAATALTVKVLSDGGAVTFYVDSVMVHAGGELHPFVDGDSVDQLYAESYNYLKQNANPAVTYELDLLDLYEVDPVRYASHNFIQGDRIRLFDEERAIDDYFLVVRREFDFLNPIDCKVTLGQKPDVFKNSLIRSMVNIARTGRGI